MSLFNAIVLVSFGLHPAGASSPENRRASLYGPPPTYQSGLVDRARTESEVIGIVKGARSSVIGEMGLVADQKTAIAIASAVWMRRYGAEAIDSRLPIVAVLSDGVWYVAGTLPSGFDKGGVPVAEIAQLDARVLKIGHGR